MQVPEPILESEVITMYMPSFWHHYALLLMPLDFEFWQKKKGEKKLVISA